MKKITYIVTQDLDKCTNIDAIITDNDCTDATIKFLESNGMVLLDNHFTRYGKDCLTFRVENSESVYYVEPFKGKVL